MSKREPAESNWSPWKTAPKENLRIILAAWIDEEVSDDEAVTVDVVWWDTDVWSWEYGFSDPPRWWMPIPAVPRGRGAP